MPNRTFGLRLTTNKINTINDLIPGTLQQNNTGVPSFAGLLGQKFDVDTPTFLAHWDTTKSAAPKVPGSIQYVQLDLSSPVTPAVGQLLYWKSKATNVVSNDDTQGWEFAGICPGTTVAKGSYFYMIIAGEPQVLFIVPTTKNGAEINRVAVGVSGNSGKADVLADATAQTYLTESANQKIGRLTSAIAAGIATVALFSPALDLY
jgi:hypothetical protein